SLFQPTVLFNRFARSITLFARKWSRRTLWIAAACALAASTLIGFAVYSRTVGVVAQVPFSDLLRQIDRNEVTEVVASGDVLEFKTAAGQSLRTVMPASYLTANAAFVPDLARKNIRIDVRSSADPAAFSYVSTLIGIALVGVLAFTVYRVSSGRILAVDQKTQEAGREQTTVTFADVAGVDEAKEEVREIVDFL